MTSQVTDVLEAVQSFVATGYDREYRVKDGNLVDLELGSTLDPCALRVDAALRLESGSDAEDASNIYAITDPATGHKGLLIDAFDVFDEMCHRDLSERLVVHRETAPAGDQEVPSKHGLRKVYKNEFDRDPERYVLREGFPDVPACPFGGAFSILGFDTAEQSYVWLVTSIIRDSRLIRIPYQGEDVDLNEAARAVVSLSSNELQKNRVEIEFDLPDDLPSVTGDRVQLQQVILNLLLNACDALSGIKDRPRRIIIKTEVDEDGDIRLTVEDTGVGIDPDTINRLFDAFYTTKDHGMGVGLSVSRSIIERHHGRIWASTNKGPGALFSVTLPTAATRAAAQSSTAIGARTEGAGHGYAWPHNGHRR